MTEPEFVVGTTCMIKNTLLKQASKKVLQIHI